MRLVCVDPARAHEVWPHVRSLIYAAMQRGDLGSFAPVEASVLRGDALLWLAIARVDGRERPDGDEKRIAAAAVTDLHETEWRKVCVVVACGAPGRSRHSPAKSIRASTPVSTGFPVNALMASRDNDVRHWIGLIDGIEKYARTAGCSATRILGRKGWARVLTSYRAKRVILEKDL
jgi:hypothetical protein